MISTFVFVLDSLYLLIRFLVVISVDMSCFYKYPLVLLYCIENYIFVFQIVGFMEFIKEAGVSPQKSMDIKNDKITIKPLRDKDVGIFSKWLAKEYIYKWFCPDGEEHKMAWLDEVNNRNTQYHYMKHFHCLL